MRRALGSMPPTPVNGEALSRTRAWDFKSNFDDPRILEYTMYCFEVLSIPWEQGASLLFWTVTTCYMNPSAEACQKDGVIEEENPGGGGVPRNAVDSSPSAPTSGIKTDTILQGGLSDSKGRQAGQQAACMVNERR
ncbi:hypothetical protein CMUS01_05077 [Colletotrichum musicola]|uniref:Uncharacterized protein n=1 Tax=Colletotrichum musicola TaxID=2175873 RepID=A0A8H6KT67_9PEZI|nr:hypothetical protein CMUS01_05077 [Colletotrichum musicola]